MTAPSSRVLLHSGWQTVNIGDIGHTPGTLRYLEQAWPAARVTLWLANTTPAVTAMLRRRFPHRPLSRAALTGKGLASTPALQDAFDACEVFIQNSGMHFNRFWDPPMHLLDACHTAGKMLCLYGQSFDGLPPGTKPHCPPAFLRLP